MILYRVITESPIDGSASLAELPEALREELTVRAKVLPKAPGYPPGAKAGKDERLDRFARSLHACEVVRAGPAGPDAAKVALAGLGLAGRLATLGKGLILDVGAGMLLTPEEALRTSGIAEMPVGWLVTVHMVEGPDGLWIHTHGAGKLGLPEVEAFGVEPKVAHEVGRAMHKLLERWTLEGGGTSGAEVPLPKGRARTVVAATGKARPAWSREPDEPSRRLLLIDAQTGGDISRLFTGEEARPEAPSFAERGEAQELIARLRARHAGTGSGAWAPPAGVTLQAKVAVEDEYGVDVLWLDASRIEGSVMKGALPSGAPIEWRIEAVLGLSVSLDGERVSGEEAARALGLEPAGPSEEVRA